MTHTKVLKIINAVFPVIGIGLMIFYGVCDTSCSSLQGTFCSVDLKVIGIFYMAVLLALTLPPASPYATSVNHLRTMLLSGALVSEILLVRFQIYYSYSYAALLLRKNRFFLRHLCRGAAIVDSLREPPFHQRDKLPQIVQ